MDTQELFDIAQRYSTPAYVLDACEFSTRLRAVRDIFGPTIDMCFSIKANPQLTRAARACGYKLEVCSPGELDICKKLNIDPKSIVYSGVCKQEEDATRALAYGVGVSTAESPLQFELINSCVHKLIDAGKIPAQPVEVLLRLNAGSQFGMCLDDLKDIIAKRNNYKYIHICGIHYFVGTQRKKLTHQEKELAKLAQLMQDLKREFDWDCAHLEYGPGLAYPYFVDQDDTDTLLPARTLAPTLKKLALTTKLTVEMGRFLASSSGTYLARIVDMKQGSDADTHYAFIDGGINHCVYLGQMMGLKVPHIQNISRDLGIASVQARACRTWTLAGSLCTTSDILVRELPLEIGMGDILAFSHIGAYSITEAMYLFLSRAMPCVVVRHAKGVYELARPAVETSQFNCNSVHFGQE